MICQRCGSLLEDDDILCPVCGTMVKRSPRPDEGGVRAIRQGRHSAVPPTLPDEPRGDVPEYGDYENSPLPLEKERGVRRREEPKPMLEAFASRPSSRRGVPVHGNARTRQVVSKHGKAKAVRLHPINWMLISVICAGILLAAAAGYFVYIKTSDTGQRITARKQVLATNEDLLKTATDADALNETARKAALKKLGDAPAQAYWLVGGEYMDAGDMDDAIMAYRIADILDPENYDGLLQLGTAYELNNEDAKAEALYLNLTKVVSPSRTDAYTALINLYLDNNRGPEAANMMLQAYTSTGKDNFRQQRKDYISNTPQVDTKHLSGRYELEQRITVTSPQGYDIYYTLDSAAELPKQGQLVKDNTVVIPEGTFVLRAVCVQGDLVSDEMKVSYTVYYPSPPAPKCNLAPNTYNSLRDVSLRAGPDTQTKEQRKAKTKDQLAKEADQTFYYTFDGSMPDPKVSPVYDGKPIALPSGDVTLRAIAVNGYGKQSSVLEVTYKFKAKPALNAIYSAQDTFTGFELNDTSITVFENQFGQPKSTADTKYLNMDAEAQQLEYAWGSAVFVLQNTQWTLMRVDMHDAFTAPPRGVGLGNAESEITAVYKDMGMPKNQDGTRNLYYNDPKTGLILNNSDGTRTVQYTCATEKGYDWVLQYVLKNGRCVEIVNYYKP